MEFLKESSGKWTMDFNLAMTKRVKSQSGEQEQM